MAEENIPSQEGVDAEIPEDTMIKADLAKASSAVAQPKIIAKISPSDDDEPEGQLTVDVYQTPSEIVVESAIAGVKPENVDVDVSSDSVTIRGTREREKEIKEENYFYRECYWGKFSRSVILPQEVEPEAASVSLKNGILSVHLPKLNRKRSKKIKIKAE